MWVEQTGVDDSTVLLSWVRIWIMMEMSTTEILLQCQEMIRMMLFISVVGWENPKQTKNKNRKAVIIGLTTFDFYSACKANDNNIC